MKNRTNLVVVVVPDNLIQRILSSVFSALRIEGIELVLTSFQPESDERDFLKEDEASIVIFQEWLQQQGGIFRLGSFLDHLLYLKRSSSVLKTSRYLFLGTARLDLIQNLLSLTDNSKDDIRLTEKETRILEILAQQEGTSVARRDYLLKEVWGYVQDMETHTLETHIYRLRQKIEKDPSSPEFLITEDEGYRWNKEI